MHFLPTISLSSQELLDYYEEQVKRLEELERARREAEEEARRQREAEEAEAGDGETEGEAGPSQEVSARSPAGHHVAIEVTAETGGSRAIPLTELESPRPGALCPSGTAKRPEGEASRPTSEEGVSELEVTPVSMAIARYLGIDLSAEGKAARNRRGIALIVNGPPMSGKTSAAIRLAKQYEAALLTVDRIIIEAIANGNTAAGLRARERCAEAAKRAEESMECEEGGQGSETKKPGLSMEAVAAHTQGKIKLLIMLL